MTLADKCEYHLRAKIKAETMRPVFTPDETGKQHEYLMPLELEDDERYCLYECSGEPGESTNCPQGKKYHSMFQIALEKLQQ